MKRLSAFIYLTVCGLSLAAQISLRVEMAEYPTAGPNDRFFLAGNFNNWNPADTQYQFKPTASGRYACTMRLPAGTYAFKCTRGDWSAVEVNGDGSDTDNRELVLDKDSSLSINIAAWKDQVKASARRSTRSPQVRMDTVVRMRGLNRMRHISIYLPADYYSSGLRYPVLYIQDGQNVFDDSTAFAGEWGVDEHLDSARHTQCIVVAIDNGGNRRFNEYSPWLFRLDDGSTGTGEGNLYADFIAKQLKPLIDRRFRTRKEKASTFIAGSSMGGLISLYAVLKYPTVFGTAGVFSPSVWIAKKSLLRLLRDTKKPWSNRIWFYAGKQESQEMVPDMLAVFNLLAKKNKAAMSVVIRDAGMHNEKSWRKEVPGFFNWLLQ
mgnify:CR=1 FL=1